MATQTSPDVKIFSSVRPLQIQRSFEGQTETVDSLGTASGNAPEEISSTGASTSKTSSSGMSGDQLGSGGSNATPLASLSDPTSTDIVKTSSSPASPQTSATTGTVLIRSSATSVETAAAPSIPGGGHNTTAAPSGTPPVQTTFVIRSASQSGQPNVQSKVIINTAPIAQSRITIGATPSSPNAPPTASETSHGEAEIIKVPNSTAPGPRRSSLTIKASPSPSATSTNSTDETISGHHHSFNEGSPNHPSAEIKAQAPQEIKAAEPTISPEPVHAEPVKDAHLTEKVHQKKPKGPSLEEALEKFNISTVFLVTLAILLAAVGCILSEDEVPLSWILAGISVISVASFIALRL